MTETVRSTPPCKEGTGFGEQAAGTELWSGEARRSWLPARREDQLLCFRVPK